MGGVLIPSCSPFSTLDIEVQAPVTVLTGTNVPGNPHQFPDIPVTFMGSGGATSHMDDRAVNILSVQQTLNSHWHHAPILYLSESYLLPWKIPAKGEQLPPTSITVSCFLLLSILTTCTHMCMHTCTHAHMHPARDYESESGKAPKKPGLKYVPQS